MNPEIDKAIKLAGGSQSALAQLITKKAGHKLSQMAVSKWQASGRVTPFYAFVLEWAFDGQVKKERLNPVDYAFLEQEKTAA